MVQWLRFHIPNAEGPGSIPGQETRSHVLQVKITCTATKTQKSQNKNKQNINIKNRLAHNTKVGRVAWGPQGLGGTSRLSPTSRDPPTPSCRVVTQSSLFVSLWTVDRQAPLSMELSWQEYWSG